MQDPSSVIQRVCQGWKLCLVVDLIVSSALALDWPPSSARGPLARYVSPLACCSAWKTYSRPPGDTNSFTRPRPYNNLNLSELAR